MLLAHIRPKTLLITERFRFYQPNQAAGESVHDFLADLRCLAITCEFEDFLDQALHDHFVCGLRAEGMQKRLLTEPDLDIARALELAWSIEAAASETKGFKDPSSIAGASGKVLNVGRAAAAVVSSGQNPAYWANLLVIDVGTTTTKDNFWSKDRNSLLSCCSSTALVIDLVSI